MDEQKVDDDPAGYEGDSEGFLSMGRPQSYKHHFTTLAGQDFEEELSFVYARSWELKEFPTSRAEAQADFSSINVIMKANFAHDFKSEDFNLAALPNQVSLKEGDFIRLVLRENPTTGYWWHTNAQRDLDAPIREVYNEF